MRVPAAECFLKHSIKFRIQPRLQEHAPVLPVLPHPVAALAAYIAGTGHRNRCQRVFLHPVIDAFRKAGNIVVTVTELPVRERCRRGPDHGIIEISGSLPVDAALTLFAELLQGHVRKRQAAAEFDAVIDDHFQRFIRILIKSFRNIHEAAEELELEGEIMNVNDKPLFPGQVHLPDQAVQELQPFVPCAAKDDIPSDAHLPMVHIRVGAEVRVYPSFRRACEDVRRLDIERAGDLQVMDFITALAAGDGLLTGEHEIEQRQLPDRIDMLQARLFLPIDKYRHKQVFHSVSLRGHSFRQLFKGPRSLMPQPVFPRP